MWMWGAGRGGVGQEEPAQWVAIILPASSAKVSGVNPSGVLEKSPQYTWIPFCPPGLHPKEGVNVNNRFLLKHSPLQSSPPPSPFLYGPVVQGTILNVVLPVANRISKCPLETVKQTVLRRSGYSVVVVLFLVCVCVCVISFCPVCSRGSASEKADYVLCPLCGDLG